LERLDTGSPPPEPRLQAAASQLISKGIDGKALGALEDGWATLLDEKPDLERIARRGSLLFEIAARLLGGSDTRLDAAGRLFAIEQVVRKRMVPAQGAEEMRELAGYRFRRSLRPLTALARLAARDARQSPMIEPEATPGRAVALVSHRLFGTVA